MNRGILNDKQSCDHLRILSIVNSDDDWWLLCMIIIIMMILIIMIFKIIVTMLIKVIKMELLQAEGMVAGLSSRAILE